LQSIINSVEISWSLSRVEKQSCFRRRRYAKRRPADTLPQQTTHFEHNETQGI